MNNLEIVNQIIGFHHKIRDEVRAMGESVTDMEAFFGLRQTYSGWTQSSVESLQEKQQKMKETVAVLGEGLHLHFNQEEKYLPLILGETLTRALHIRHRNIWEKFELIKAELDVTLAGKTRDDILAFKTRLQNMMNELAGMIEKHATEEDVVLGMAKAALETPEAGT